MSAMMKTVQEDRREEFRLAGGGPLQAVVLDEHRQPVLAIDEAHVVNVSAGGLAMMTATPVPVGAMIAAVAGSAADGRPEKSHLTLQVLECSPLKTGWQRVRAKLVEGRMPAQLIYHW